jgi:flavorubredoxin
MLAPRAAVSDLLVLPSSQQVPGHGFLPVNAYVLRERARALLVDTGPQTEREAFLDALWSIVAPSDLAAVFLTHEDFDHAGSLDAVLDAAPQATLVTNYVTVGKLLERTSIPLDRVRVVNDGDRVPGLEREVRVVRPPLFDAPGTLGVFDVRSRALLTVDAFGTYLPQIVPELDDVAERDVRAGLRDFNRLNHPWATTVDARAFAAAIGRLRALDPAVLLSSHGAIARDECAVLLDEAARLPGMEPLVPPDQATFEARRCELSPSRS